MPVSGENLGSLAAIGVLLGSAVSAFTGRQLVGPNRRKIIAEGGASERESWRAALDTALEHYEADNGRLRAQLDELEKRATNDVTERADLRARFEACAAERDALRGRVERMLERFAELGQEPPS